jgi:hypothetical protein
MDYLKTAKIEDVKDLPKVDTLISEPIGVLLVHERMIESYLYARDHFLKPGGAMIPSTGNIFVAPVSRCIPVVKISQDHSQQLKICN